MAADGGLVVPYTRSNSSASAAKSVAADALMRGRSSQMVADGDFVVLGKPGRDVNTVTLAQTVNRCAVLHSVAVRHCARR